MEANMNLVKVSASQACGILRRKRFRKASVELATLGLCSWLSPASNLVPQDSELPELHSLQTDIKQWVSDLV